ncbi:MAG: phasin family protein [Opitutales bacterium]
MIDILKKSLLAGVGATVVTAEKVESVLDDLVKRGKLSAEDARSAASQIADEGRREFEESRTTLNNFLDELMARGNLATKRDLERLETRLVELEVKIATTPPTPATPAEGEH